MPSKSKQQQKFMGLVHAYKKGEVPASKVSQAVKDAAKSMKKSSVKKYAKTKHKGLPTKKVNEKVNKELKRIYQLLLKYGNSRKDAMNMIKKNMKYVNKKYSSSSPRSKAIALVGLSSLGEATKRDYKAEYKKFQSSTKAKKYRAELNKYNRQKGTYGNGDGKDASHKGGKIVGFEKESTNRGRAEKSRLKKENLMNKLNEAPNYDLDGMKKFIDNSLKRAGIKVLKFDPMKKSFTSGIWGGFYTVRSNNKVDMPGQGKVKRGSTVLPFYIDKDGKIDLGVSSKKFIIGVVGDESRVIKNLKSFKKSDLDEGYSMRDLGLSPFFKKLNPMQRQAVSIALVMGGNMTGAVKAIEKIKKGLSKDKKVKNALKMANEGFASAAQRRAAFASGYKAKGKKKKNESVNEVNMAHVYSKDLNKKKFKDLGLYLSNVLDLAPNKDFRLTTNKKLLAINIDKINPKSLQNIKKRFGIDLKQKAKEPIRLKSKSGMGKISHLGMESVNESISAFDVDFYKDTNNRQTSHKEIVRGDKFSDVISKTTKVAKSKGMNYVELYYKGAFIGSIDKRNNFKFRKGRNHQKSPLSVNEGIGDMMSKKIGKHKGTRNKAEVGNILKYLMKKGDAKKDALDKIKQNYDYVSKKYRSASVSKKADILTSLQESIVEGIFGKFDTGAAFKGNGMTVYDRNQEKAGDYKDIAHIGEDGKITIYDRKVKKEPKLMQSLNKISQEFKKTFKESVNEAPMELNKIKDAIKMFQKKIEKQGRVTNARDEEHLKNLIKLYIQMGGKGVKESKLNENPAAIAATQAMTKMKMKNPKTGKDVSAASALKSKDNPNHKKAKSIFQRLKDKFSKKKDDKPKPKQQSKADADFYKRQFTGEEKLREYIREEIKNLKSVNEKMDKRQAGEMLKQLGGNRFIMMTGAKNFTVGPKGAGFKIGRNAKGVNYVRIDLDRGKDLYNMSFDFVSVRGIKNKAKVKGVYADQLQKMFTKHTGMYTSLGTMGR